MAILSEGCKPDNICGLCSNFVNIFLNQTLLKYLLCVRQTWMTQLILAISLRLSSLIWKDSSTHFHGRAVYIKEELPFACMKTLQILTYVFHLLYFTQCLTFFPSVDHLLCLYVWFLILFQLT